MRFTRHARVGRRLLRTFRGFVGASSSGSPPPHHSLHSHRSRAPTDCCLGSRVAARIEFLLLPEAGVILPASRWQAPGCALTAIRRHRQTTRSKESQSWSSPSGEHANVMESHLPEPFMLETGFGMPAHLALWAFRSSASVQVSAPRDLLQRAQFECSRIFPRTGCFWRLWKDFHEGSMARNIEIKAHVESVEALAPKAAAIADEGPIEIIQDDTFFRCDSGRLKLRAFLSEEGLSDFGLQFSRRRIHRGQGTANACAFFDN